MTSSKRWYRNFLKNSTCIEIKYSNLKFGEFGTLEYKNYVSYILFFFFLHLIFYLLTIGGVRMSTKIEFTNIFLVF